MHDLYCGTVCFLSFCANTNERGAVQETPAAGESSRVESSGACTSTGLSSPALWQVRGLIVENSFTGIEDMARELLPPLRVLPHWVLRPLVWSRWLAPGPSKKRKEKKRKALGQLCTSL